MTDLLEWERAYIAGFVDADGSIGMHMHSTGYNKIAVVTLTATNKDEAVLRFIQSKFLGEVVKTRSTNPNACYIFNYKLMGRDRLRYALESILPYMIVKRDRACLALEYFEMCPPQQGTKLTEEQHEIRNGFIEKFRALNKVGVK